MKKIFIVVGLLSFMLFASFSCAKKPSKVEQMRMEKAQKDSMQFVQAEKTVAYSDSLLQVLMPQADSLLKFFRYEKNENYEDHGTYVHKLLTTNKNDHRCYLQAYVTDDRKLVLQSFYYGDQPIRQNMLRLNVGDLFVEAEGTNHAFEVEGWHEVMSIPQQDAIQLLAFISGNMEERIRVTPKGKGQACYYLQKNEKEALATTYQLALVMQDIDQLERAVRVSSRQADRLSKKK